MESLNIWINYHPRLYQDLLLEVIKHVGEQKNGIKVNIKKGSIINHPALQEIDVALMSLDKLENNYPLPLSRFSEGSKLISFSPVGIYGWIFQHRIGRWELIYPFGIHHIFSEVFGSSFCYTE